MKLRATFHHNLHTRFQGYDPANPDADVHGLDYRRRELSEPRVGVHEAREPVTARGDDAQSTAQIVFPIGGTLVAGDHAFEVFGH